MPIKLGLVFLNRNVALPIPNSSQSKPVNKQLIVEKIAEKPKGISLRRVVGVPNPGCKSCRG
jgi:hypothetical protein